jgi:uncharacterized membrane protein
MFGRLLRPLTALFLIAGLVHIIAILLIPSYAPRHAYDAILAAMPAGRLSVFDERPPPIPALDPAFVHGVCPITPATGPVRLGGVMPDTFWSVAVVSDTGRIVASMTREDADSGSVDIIAGKAGDVLPPSSVTNMPLVENAGFVLVRAMLEHQGARAAVVERLKALVCAPVGPKT